MSNSDVTTPVRLIAHAEDESTRIEVLDGNLNVVPGSSRLGETTVDVSPGAYAVRFHIGADYVQRMAILAPQSADTHIWLNDADAPRFATSAPVRHTKSTREFHREPAQQLSRSTPVPGTGGVIGNSQLLLFARDLVEGRQNDPTRGLTLHDMTGALVADFEKVGERDPVDRWGGAHIALGEGPYRLRLSGGSRRFTEQIIYLVKGWQTQVFLLAEGVGNTDADRSVSFASASILMAKPHEGFDPERPDLRWTESALRALRQPKSIPGDVRSEMLWAKFQNPMLGIYGGLLHLRREHIDRELLRAVFHNLKGLVGPLPDVLAIGWGLAMRDPDIKNDVLFMQALDRPGDLSAPPMLRVSWELLVQASVLRPEIVPAGSFAERASTRLTTAGPWFTWRGEPPPPQYEPQPKLAPEVHAKSPLGIFFHPFLAAFSEMALGAAIHYLAKVLEKSPNAGYFLYSNRFTDAERRVAQYVYPLVDPQLATLIEGDERLRAEVIEGMKERGNDEMGLVKALNIPSGAALAAVWGLVRKLVLQPVVPHKLHLSGFLTSEAHGNKALESLLQGLQKQSTSLQHSRSQKPINMLAFLFLIYRGSPAAASDVAPTMTSLAELLHENEYVLGEADEPLDEVALDSILKGVRTKVLTNLKMQVGKQSIQFSAGWQEQVFPDPNTYKPGKLLPVPAEQDAGDFSSN